MKALCLFSGGLDSILASELIRAQGIEVLGFFYETPFFQSQKALKSAENINLPIKVIDITNSHLEVIKNPKYGYGKYMNPCIDCHTLMIRKTGELLEDEGAHFIITGEVLGQRPMSQNRKALSIVSDGSGFNSLILRPLSGKRLPMTMPEKEGWVKRDQLMDFSGRSRKPQMELAKKFNIKEFPSPAGGCLLTDPVFSRRLRDLFSAHPDFELREIELLKFGRHFRIGSGTKLIIGRNKLENQAIQSLSDEKDLLLSPVSVPGPTVLAFGGISSDGERLAASITVSYSDAENSSLTEVSLWTKGVERVLKAKGCNKEKLKCYMI